MKQAKPTYEAVIENCKIFVANETRQRYYTWAFKTVADAYGQGQPENIDILGVVSGIMILEYSWNEMFYRDGLFDQLRLAECLEKHAILVSRFRNRDIGSFQVNDQEDIARLFSDLLDALGRQNSRLRSPVAVGKCLHLLSPHFFPLWDGPIAKGTGYYWGTPVKSDTATKFYMDFMKYTQELADHIAREFASKGSLPLEIAFDAILKEYEKTVERRAVETTMLKLLDEYLHVEHTHPEWKRH
jgi:hypothetical protein